MTEPLYSVPESTFLQQPRRMLPQAMGATSISDAPADGLTMARQRYKSLQDEIDRLQAQEPDLSAMQEFARRQGEMGQNALLNAIAAQYAGEAFQPLQAKFLRQAEASQQPLRIGSTMITPSGEIIRDPTAQQQTQLGILSRRADRAAGEIGLYERARERADAEKERQRERIEARAAEEERDRRTKLFLASLVGGRGSGQGQSAQAPINIPLSEGSLVDPNINLRSAMGGRGFIENTWSNIANLFGGGDPEAANRQATATLDALATRTRNVMTGNFPGRSSVELLKQLERHTIKPNDLFTGVASVPSKATANIAMLEDDIAKLRQSMTINLPPTQRALLQQKIMSNEALIKDYKTLLGAARNQTITAAPQIAPRGQQQPAVGLSPAEQQEFDALRKSLSALFGRQ